MTKSTAYIKWFEEENPGAGPARVRAAWLVRDVRDAFGERVQVLAYLGQRPAVTEYLKEEVAALYPDLEIDWERIRQTLAGHPDFTHVQSLTDDELLLRLRALAHERGLSLMDLSLRLGYRHRQILPELTALVEDAGNVARFERTSGSVFDYMAQQHPEYAYLVYKARLFFEADESKLQDEIAAEPGGFDDLAWRTKRRFWRRRLDDYRRRRRPPSVDEA
ncbi:MAG: hypothetical protein HY332_16255 [Chloroflexi bacterium]|nr:hypothetical protein [Chloroflexota bacterium]